MNTGFGFGSPTPTSNNNNNNNINNNNRSSFASSSTSNFGFGTSTSASNTSITNTSALSFGSSQNVVQNSTSGFGSSNNSLHNLNSNSGLRSSTAPSSGFAASSSSSSTLFQNPFSSSSNSTTNITSSSNSTTPGFSNSVSGFGSSNNSNSATFGTPSNTLPSSSNTNTTSTALSTSFSSNATFYSTVNSFASPPPQTSTSTHSNQTSSSLSFQTPTHSHQPTSSINQNEPIMVGSSFGASSGFGGGFGINSNHATDINLTTASSSQFGTNGDSSTTQRSLGFGASASASNAPMNPFMGSNNQQQSSSSKSTSKSTLMFGSPPASSAPITSTNISTPFSPPSNTLSTTAITNDITSSNNTSWKTPSSFSNSNPPFSSNTNSTFPPSSSSLSSTMSGKEPTPPSKQLSKLNAQIEEKKRKLLERLQAKKLQSQSNPSNDKQPDSKKDLAERNALRFSSDPSVTMNTNNTNVQDLPPDLQRLANQPKLHDSINSSSDNKDQDATTSLIGICQHMCPDDELLRRQTENDIQLFELLSEKLHPSHWTLRNTTVKRFRRSAADFKLDIPALVRTPFTLERTCGYLEEWIMERDRQGPDPRFAASPHTSSDTPTSMEVYQFIWDRTRMIRKDFILMNYQANGTVGGKCSASSVRVHERIARWHAMMEHQLSHISDFVEFHSQQNIQELGQTMKTLNLYYDDNLKRSVMEEPNYEIDGNNGNSHGCQHDQVQGPTPTDFDGADLNGDHSHTRIVGKSHPIHHGTAEPEMRALYILLTMDNDGGMEVLKYAGALCVENAMVFKSRPVQLALSVYKAKKEENYARFFSILKSPSTPYLFACVMFKHVEQMRKIAFQRMYRLFGARSADGNTIKYDDYPLKDLVNLLCFEDDKEAYEACKHYNIKVKRFPISENNSQIRVLWKHSQFCEAKDPEKGTSLRLLPKKMIRTIERKVMGSTRLAICRGDVSGEGSTLTHPLVARNQSKGLLPSPSKASFHSSISQGEDHMTKQQESVLPSVPTTQVEDAQQKMRETQKRQAEESLKQQQQLEKARQDEEKRQAEIRAKQEADKSAAEKARKEQLQAEQIRKQKEVEQKRLAMIEEAQKRKAKEAERIMKLKLQKEAQEKALRLEQERLQKQKEAVKAKRRRLEQVQRAEEERQQKIAYEKEQQRILALARIKAQKLKEEQERQLRLEKEEQERKRREEVKRRHLALQVLATKLAFNINRVQKRHVFSKLLDFINCPETRYQNVQRSLSRIDSTFSPYSSSTFNSKPPTKTHRIISHHPKDKMKEELFYRITEDSSQNKINLSHMLGQSLSRHLVLQTRETSPSSTHPNIVHPATTNEESDHPYYHSRHVLLCKVAILLPETITNENGIHDAVSYWIHSQLSCGKVQVETFLYEEELYEIRTIVINASHDPSKISGADIVLFVIPPLGGEDMGGNEYAKVSKPIPTFSQSSHNEIHSGMIRMALVLDNGDYHYLDSIKASMEFTDLIRGGIHYSDEYGNESKDIHHVTVVNAVPEHSSRISKALELCFQTLMNRFRKQIVPSKQFEPVALKRVKLLHLCQNIILQSLQHYIPKMSKTSHGSNMEGMILKLFLSIPSMVAKELNDLGNELMKQSIALWPAEEFSISINSHESIGANVPNYFEDRSSLPLYWLSILTDPNLDQEIRTILQIPENASSLSTLVTSMLNGSPLSTQQKCHIFLETNRFISCFETVFLWLDNQDHSRDTGRHDSSTSFASVLYLPSWEKIDRIMNRVLKNEFGNVVDSTITAGGEWTHFTSLMQHNIEERSLIPIENTLPVNSSISDPQSKSSGRKRSSEVDNTAIDTPKVKTGVIDANISTKKLQDEESDTPSIPQRKRSKIDNPIRTKFRKQKQTSSAFTRQLEALLHQDTIIDMSIGDTYLSQILASAESTRRI